MIAAELIRFWSEEIGPKGWYAGGDEIDTLIADRYCDLWLDAADGGLGQWLTDPEGALAYILLTDQFPRNMFRDTAQAFDTDANARAATKFAIDQGWDLAIAEPLRQFFYLPLMHSENIVDQDRSLACFRDRMKGKGNLAHAQAHRWIIRKFGRFPYRNKALSRETTLPEAAFLEYGGYRFALAMFDDVRINGSTLS